MGAVETLICWENLDIQRVGFTSSSVHNFMKSSLNVKVIICSHFHFQVTLKNHASGEEKILFLNSEQEKDKTLYTDQVVPPILSLKIAKHFQFFVHHHLVHCKANMFHIQETGVEMELEENMPLLEWLANNYKKFGAGLEIITDRSQVRQLS